LIQIIYYFLSYIIEEYSSECPHTNLECECDIAKEIIDYLYQVLRSQEKKIFNDYYKLQSVADKYNATCEDNCWTVWLCSMNYVVNKQHEYIYIDTDKSLGLFKKYEIVDDCVSYMSNSTYYQSYKYNNFIIHARYSSYDNKINIMIKQDLKQSNLNDTASCISTRLFKTIYKDYGRYRKFMRKLYFKKRAYDCVDFSSSLAIPITVLTCVPIRSLGHCLFQSAKSCFNWAKNWTPELTEEEF
jgi:hypothetical protein